ncbi:hypothetical protein ACFWSF_28305 [Streptomyces sp. NPDC058611]|uniref:hypothetical protein n=1 Tax=unclassified Streptomyces TaxID=2593676 RepID=UPI003661F9B9
MEAATDWLPGYPFVFRALARRIGEPGRTYVPGERLTVRLRRTDGTSQEARNHAWHPGILPDLLERAGFRDVIQPRPTVDEARTVADPGLAGSRAWAAERERPPLVVTTGLAV